MKKRIVFLIATVVMILNLVLPAFAAGTVSGNAVVFSGSKVTIKADELEANYYNSDIKYYEFNVDGITVSADKNNFYDFNLKSVLFTLSKRAFNVTYTYTDGKTKKLASVPLAIRYTVTGDDITASSAPYFGNEMATVISSSAGKTVFDTTMIGSFKIKAHEFSDVKDPAMWYYKYINGCAAMGVLSGMGDGTFMPDNTVTRAELAVMIVRSTSDIISYRIDDSLKFSDVKKGMWYYDAIMKCASMGIVFGKTTDTYAPGDPATREQIAAVIARVIDIAGSYGGKELPSVSSLKELTKLYPDAASISNYAKGNVLLCNKLKIMVGDERGFRPQANTTRAECAVIFYDIKNSLI